MTKRKNKARWMAVVLIAAMIIGMLGMSIASYAATATVPGTDVNVRESASTSSSVVGQAKNGDTFEVGEPETDSSGAKWYKVTLSGGATGYIRSDLLSVQEEEEPAESAESAETAEAPADSEETPAEAPAEAPAEEPANEKYKLVNLPDDSGNEVWYLYDYEAGLRIKVEDLSQYDTIKASADSYQKKAGQYKVIVYILGGISILLLLALVFALFRLRDAGSHEVDIADLRRREQMRSQGRGSRAAVPARTGRDGSRAYPSGAARREGAVRGERPAPRMPQDPARAARPAQRPVRSQQPRMDREAYPGKDEDVRVARPAKRPVQPRNFAADDDLEYGFLNKDEN